MTYDHSQVLREIHDEVRGMVEAVANDILLQTHDEAPVGVQEYPDCRVMIGVQRAVIDQNAIIDAIKVEVRDDTI